MNIQCPNLNIIRQIMEKNASNNHVKFIHFKKIITIGNILLTEYHYKKFSEKIPYLKCRKYKNIKIFTDNSEIFNVGYLKRKNIKYSSKWNKILNDVSIIHTDVQIYNTNNLPHILTLAKLNKKTIKIQNKYELYNVVYNEFYYKKMKKIKNIKLIFDHISIKNLIHDYEKKEKYLKKILRVIVKILFFAKTVKLFELIEHPIHSGDYFFCKIIPKYVTNILAKAECNKKFIGYKNIQFT